MAERLDKRLVLNEWLFSQLGYSDTDTGWGCRPLQDRNAYPDVAKDMALPQNPMSMKSRKTSLNLFLNPPPCARYHLIGMEGKADDPS